MKPTLEGDDTITSPDKDLADLMMRNIVELGRFSYELEEKREQSLITQSSYMLTAFSIFSALLGFLSPFIAEYASAPIRECLPALTIVFLLLIASLVSAILAQWRYSYKAMDNVEKIFEAVYQGHEKYTSQAQFYFQWKEQLSEIHVSKRKSNDRRVKYVVASMIFFLSAIMFFLLSATSILFFTPVSWIVALPLSVIVLLVDVLLWFKFTENIRKPAKTDKEKIGVKLNE